jgi:hypothetical protein
VGAKLTMGNRNTDASTLRPVKRRFFFSFFYLYTTQLFVSKILVFLIALHHLNTKKGSSLVE